MESKKEGKNKVTIKEKEQDTEDKKDCLRRMKELVERLNEASYAYYQKAEEIMTNYEYDCLYEELEQLEKQLQLTLSNSPTIRVGYEVLSELPKIEHDSPMLSLDKTKDREALKAWLGEQEGILSWKEDGLTIVLSYENGELLRAVTRGNGAVGEVITNNARVFQNVPLTIAHPGKLVLRGEAVIRYSDFERINATIAQVEAKYKNPRNLCSGTVRQLNNEITAKRPVYFYAFSLVEAEGRSFEKKSEQLAYLRELGFDTVEGRLVTQETILETVAWFEERVAKNDIPSDGLVLTYDDLAYSRGLGRTAKFPRDSYAFKWKDEIRETTLVAMEWSASRTGLINPVAIFEPVELEGTVVKRASVHNVSIVEGLELGIGDTIEVYKANMIIPQIAANQTRSGNLKIPETCPVCGAKTVIHEENGVKTLYCENPECQAKRIKAFSLFVSRDALNIEGLSEATLEKLIDRGLVRSFRDLFHLDQHEAAIKELEGFGQKSYDRLMDSVEKSRHTTLAKVLYGIGIENVGLSYAKLICRAAKNDPEKLMQLTKEELVAIDTVGEVIADSFVQYFHTEEHREMLQELLSELELEKEELFTQEQLLEGKVFVITGSLEHFSNRSELKEKIEALGGKVTGSVTGKTDYLINNDVTSGSGKNKKAKELGIAILSEEAFLAMIEKRPHPGAEEGKN